MSRQFIYIARHGETVGNKEDIVQTFDEKLTEAGLRQAEQLAKRAAKLKFSRLFSSDMTRAQETAICVEKETGVHVEFFADLREFENPSRFQGKPRHEAEFLQHVKDRINSFALDDWDFKDSDESSFREFYHRVDRVKAFIESEDEDCFLVTHGHFLRFFTASVLCGELFSPKIWHSFGNRMMLSNTGVSVFVRDTNDGRWYLAHWNDTSHFADN